MSSDTNGTDAVRRRRAFLTGRRPVLPPWQALCEQLARRFPGALSDRDDAACQARLRVVDPSDAWLARDWCAAHGVALGLWGMSSPAPVSSVLWLDPAPAGFHRLEGEATLWFVQPGCPVGRLAAAGAGQLAHLPPELPAAVWLADRRWHGWPTGQGWRAGVRGASILLDDGDAVTLGPFGVHAPRALEGLRLQQLVPALFRLAGDPAAARAADRPQWPARYRLDALSPDPDHDVNLAGLLLGHGGGLGWVQWLVLAPASPASQPMRPPVDEAEWAALDHAVKALFDPRGRWLSAA